MLYKRAAGYFTSNGLSVAAKGLAQMVANGGKIELIASPILEQADIDAIEKGNKNREEILLSAAYRGVNEIASGLVKKRLEVLAWLVANNQLSVRLALKTSSSGSYSKGLYHEKIGVILDAHSDFLSFAGSSNETSGGLVTNFERIDVFKSWDEGESACRARLTKDDFETIWEDRAPGLEVLDFSDATNELLQSYRPRNRPSFFERDEDSDAEKNVNPASIQLRDYQEQVIDNWRSQGGRGIIALATGCGKTFTALAAFKQLVSERRASAAVIVCPYRHLVDQWAGEAKQHFGFQSIMAMDSRSSWQPDLNSALAVGAGDYSKPIVAIATNATFTQNSFNRLLKYFPNDSLIVCDEVHNLGTSSAINCLPEAFRYRLGLSATPKREFDPAGTQQLFDYFGQIVQPQIGIKEAIEKEVLSPYFYHPILVRLTEDEAEEYTELSNKIAGCYQPGLSLRDNQPLTSLLAKRSRLVGAAHNKLSALEELMRSERVPFPAIFYCGDGLVTSNSETVLLQRQIEAVTRILGINLGLRVASYTAETSISRRRELRSELECGDIQALVAIRCLDEGVDIPAIKSAVILASTSNPRQFIQRRGRVLRRSPEKDQAEIFDMLVLPPSNGAANNAGKRLFANELKRFEEFAKTSLNYGSCLGILSPVKKELNLLDQ